MESPMAPSQLILVSERQLGAELQALVEVECRFSKSSFEQRGLFHFWSALAKLTFKVL